MRMAVHGTSSSATSATSTSSQIERNYVPCVKNGREGLYDAVSKKVYYSQGSADFQTPTPASVVTDIAK